MSYKIDHIYFMNELWINAFKNQVDDYPFASPKRRDFDPEVPTVGITVVNRKATLELPAYTFTDEQKAILLEEE